MALILTTKAPRHQEELCSLRLGGLAVFLTARDGGHERDRIAAGERASFARTHLLVADHDEERGMRRARAVERHPRERRSVLTRETDDEILKRRRTVELDFLRRPSRRFFRLREIPHRDFHRSCSSRSAGEASRIARSEEHTSELQSLAYLVCR